MLSLLFTAIFCFTILASYLMTPYFIELFVREGCLTRNFKDKQVPQGIGIVFTLYSLPIYTLYFFINNNYPTNLIEIGSMLIMISVLYTVGLLGFIDDVLGSRDVLGLIGHTHALLKGRLTTGIIKAVGVITVSLIGSIFLSYGLWTIILNTLVTALFANLLNMFDLRPGRAIKFYLLLVIVFVINIILTRRYYLFILIMPIVGSVIGYFPFDIKGHCMMGDAGANLLGASLGILSIIQYGNSVKLTMFIALILIHIFAEKYSLSDLIKYSKLLNFIDELGRCKNDQIL